MKVVIQRARTAEVLVDGLSVASIGSGMVVLAGFNRSDTKDTVVRLSRKIVRLRIFEDPQGKMNYSVLMSGGEVLIVSQFTLYADCKDGNRPSYGLAMPANEARELYEMFLSEISSYGVRVSAGVFQADMLVNIAGDGPVTIVLESD